jgi:hypothetical protein
MILIIFGIALLILLISIYRLNKNKKYIINLYRNGNVGANGKKRKGKDILHQFVIYHRHENYYANIDYGYYLVEKIDLSKLQIKGLTYQKFIEGGYLKTDRIFAEKTDIYISDGGNYLPSQYQKELVQKYPSLSIFLSLQGHLYDSNTHFNWNGESNRIWDKVREQFDEYLRIIGSVNIGIGRFVFLRHYSRLQAFEENKLPYKKNKMFDSTTNKAMRNQYEAENGIIKNMWIYMSYKKMKYDTRAFEKMIFKDDSQRIIL